MGKTPKWVEMSLYEVSKCYEHFYVKPLPDKMPYVKALEILVREFGAERLRAYVETLPLPKIKAH